MTHFDTLVLGAGHTGLAMSRCLQKAGRTHLVLERDTIGASWRTRWDSFHLNTPSQNSCLPDVQADERDVFWSRDAWIAHLEGYANKFDLPVRTGVTVTSVDKRDGLFQVDTTAGRFTARHVVVCTGDQNIPRTPSLAAEMPGDLTQVHVLDYANPAALPDGAVLVVGSAQSGGQVAEDLLQAGRTVHLCTSRVGRAPRRYRGRDITDWAQALGLHNHGPNDVPAEQRQARQGLISGTDGGKSLSLPLLARRGVHLLGRLMAVDGRKLEIGSDLRDNVAAGDLAVDKLTTGLDGFIAAQGLDVPPADADPADEPFDGVADMAEVRSLDLDAAGIRTVVWATGFTGSFAYLPEGWREPTGLPRHTDGVGEVSGLYFLGLQWGRRRISGLIMGAEGDAERILDHLAEEAHPAAREVVALHASVEAWITGRSSADAFSDVSSRFHSSFALVAPSGARLTRADLMAGISASHGANPDFSMRIRDITIVADGPECVVARCTMWQRGAKNSSPDNGRHITCVFVRDARCPHGLAWIHAHESWLPEEEQVAGPYDW
ncbi:MAG: NAD(P)-binding domain-containing protein [Proteobacteria bacterium]|nr:NAD(P)-binding domain-containing protein [Pseudomonadota bacterium]